MKPIVTLAVLACTIQNALQALTPGAIWTLSNSDYATITWSSVNSQPQPSKAATDLWIANCQLQAPTPSLEERVTDLENAVTTISVKTGTPVILNAPTQVSQ